MRQILLYIVLCLSFNAWAFDDFAKRIIYNTFQLEGQAEVVEERGAYTRIVLPDSVTLEIYKSDSIVVVMTACAPQCSSCARIYNKEWKLVGAVTPPFVSVFPLARLDKTTGRIIWTDNDNWEY
ncbi:MAG: hypothetical protein II140_05990 [Paludibacteraceae bacterium]|nr:hypothetical protein [Paludibacteraceae bacterium]MBQ2520519.1 hypothetical protein [Paludibacteraceae bacterium]MBQ5379707.1 hypothetical protein [Paludibacteraceae bacterium]